MPQAPEKNDKRLAKGRQTRERLLAEALRLFAQHGYAGVGTREVAAAAKTNIASIAFHFSGKEGLYRAVIEHVSGELARLHQAAIAEATAQSAAGGEEAGDRAKRIVTDLITRLLTSNRSRWMTLLLQREFITPTPFFDVIYESTIEPTLTALAALASEINGKSQASPENKVLAFSLFIMTSAFQRNRNTFLRFIEKDAYSPEDIETISRVVARFVKNGLLQPQETNEALSPCPSKQNF
ncbi:transcriptional regulator, TetR family [Solidesulfovibrio fructosivorans JJ]]|uniref:Transcriptional regulator, TetR family n=1 Tax=Solidesulfovibrio fructosivorans JJ] TaxID=596151 RepID=E1JTK9_SOLFR|nr:CerR family C-terminal domain-containing protein [Solidesulfovibrio fructosivorans]EFL52469.1 transcriptional regulator, TetR family [Solidesulfovibrio fructosivorans JJ]]